MYWGIVRIIPFCYLGFGRSSESPSIFTVGSRATLGVAGVSGGSSVHLKPSAVCAADVYRGEC